MNYIGFIWGMDKDKGKKMEVAIFFGLYWGYARIMEKEMETSIL